MSLLKLLQDFNNYNSPQKTSLVAGTHDSIHGHFHYIKRRASMVRLDANQHILHDLSVLLVCALCQDVEAAKLNKTS